MVEQTVLLFGICLILGSVVGVLSGLLGIGGGLVVVPALVFLLPKVGVSSDLVMHIALGTSLATIVLTSSSSARNHMKFGNVDFVMIKPMIPGIILGGIIGTVVANWVPVAILPKIFAVIALLLGIQMLLSVRIEHKESRYPSLSVSFFGGGVIGLLSSLAGIGGGSLTVPFLSWFGIEMRKAVGTSSLCGAIIGISGMIGFIIAGAETHNLPPLSLGYVYLPALLGIVSTSIFTTRLGARWATDLPTKVLKKGFAILLLLISVKMFLG